MFQFLWSCFISDGLKCSLNGSKQPFIHPGRLCRETTVPVYRDLRPCLCRPDQVRVYSISICVLSGCGENTEKHTSKQNSCVSRPSAYLSLSSLFSLFTSPQTPPSQPVAELQQRLGKADCGIPGKPLRAQSEEWGRVVGERLAQHVCSTFGVFFKRRWRAVHYVQSLRRSIYVSVHWSDL